MDTLAALGHFLTVLDANHFAAVVLVVLVLISKLGPPKG